jgi:hypothetical protein
VLAEILEFCSQKAAASTGALKMKLTWLSLCFIGYIIRDKCRSGKDRLQCRQQDDSTLSNISISPLPCETRENHGRREFSSGSVLTPRFTVCGYSKYTAPGHDGRPDRTHLDDQVHWVIGFVAYIQPRIIGSAAGGQRRSEGRFCCESPGMRETRANRPNSSQ